MATRQVVTMADDVDGSAATETVEFSLDGTDYAIDVSATNAAALREVLQPWIAAGRRLARNGQPYWLIDLDAQPRRRRRSRR